jgi:AcrR family transcriptional regulator
MVEDEKRRRAPAMSQEERRAAIVRSTLPLLLEHGGNISTSQIAAAAGIAEGTVFRAFKDKPDLLLACLRAGMDSDEEVATIGRIGRDGPLAERLTRAVQAISGYIDRIWTVGQALRTSGVDQQAMQRRMHGEGGEEPRPGPPPELLRLSDAMSELFDETADNLRVAPARAVRILLGLVLTNRMQGPGFGPTTEDPAEIVDLFLHGVIHSEKGNHQ